MYRISKPLTIYFSKSVGLDDGLRLTQKKNNFRLIIKCEWSVQEPFKSIVNVFLSSHQKVWNFKSALEVNKTSICPCKSIFSKIIYSISAI